MRWSKTLDTYYAGRRQRLITAVTLVHQMLDILLSTTPKQGNPNKQKLHNLVTQFVETTFCGTPVFWTWRAARKFDGRHL